MSHGLFIRGAIPSIVLYSACFHPDAPADGSGPGTSTDGTAPPVTGTSDPDTDPSTPTTAPPETTADATAPTTEPSSTSSSVDDTTTTTDDTTTGPGTCAEAALPDDWCLAADVALPYCDLDGGVCVACLDDLGCGVGQVCDPDTHTCVECVAADDCINPEKPACDPDTHTCGCDEHSQCPATACDLEVRTCFPGAQTEIVWSSAATGSMCRDTEPACTMMDPCCSVSKALAKAVSLASDYVVIRVLPGQDGVHDAVEFTPETANKRIAVLGWPEATLESLVGGAPVLYINAPTRVYAARLTLRSGGVSTAGAGVSCFSGNGAWADDVTVDPLPFGVGFFANACPMQVRRSSVRGAEGGVWLAGDATGRFVDTIVAHPSEYGLRAYSGADIELVFSTVVESTGVDRRLLQCTGVGSSITARNSLLFAVPELGSNDCPGSTATHSVVTGDTLIGPGSSTIDDADVQNLFVSYPTGNLHILPGAVVLSGKALREPGDPPVDIDGDPRPLLVGGMDWAGADVP